MTRQAGVIGAPIRHSLSPAIFTAAFDAADLDWAYDAYEVAAGEAPVFVERMRQDLWGLSVTMPHKEAVLPALDRLTDIASDLGAVNCIARDGSQLVGHNTDGPGLVDALTVDEGLTLDGSTCALLGAGGVGRAVARALGAAGAEVIVVNRSPDRAAEAARLAGPAGRVGVVADVTGADLVVNATPVGMAGDEHLPLPVELLHPDLVVVDLVYHPAVTPLLEAAATAGARTIGGLGMLVHQAAHAFRIWTDEPAPLAAMRAGAERALAAGCDVSGAVATALSAAAGIPVGAFLNVAIERTPERVPLRAAVEGEERPPRSWLGLPVQPWLLRGGAVGERRRRWLVVELVTAAAFGILAGAFPSLEVALPLMVVAAGLVAVTFVDLEHLRIPDRITFPTLAVAALTMTVVSIDRSIPRALWGGLIGAGFYFVLLLLPHLAYPRGMGFGDVKLALLMGLALGWIGRLPHESPTDPYRLVLQAMVLGCLLGVVFGIGHQAITRRRGEFPFGPALALGCFLVLLSAA